MLQSIFLGTRVVSVLTRDNHGRSRILGRTVTPEAISKVFNQSVMSYIIADTLNVKLTDSQPSLWSTTAGTMNVTSLVAALENANDASDYPSLSQDLFSSALPVGTDTGILRYLETRLNTSISCVLVPQANFPESCKGLHPFERKFSNIRNTTDPYSFGSWDYPRYRGRLCAPGNIGASPWSPDAKRQDIYEELWIDFQFTNMSDVTASWAGPGYPRSVYSRANITQRCTSNSTLGYFELPNYWNGHTVGPLLAEVSPNSHNKSIHNWAAIEFPAYKAATSTYGEVPGPLLTATLAMFGPGTFFELVANEKTQNMTSDSALTLEFCRRLRYPFSGLRPEPMIGTDKNPNNLTDWDVPDHVLDCGTPKPQGEMVWTPDLVVALITWLTNFASSASATTALTTTVYSVHRNLFNAQTTFYDTLDSIEASLGTTYEKPEMSPVPRVVISVLLAVQLFSLGFLAFYTWLRPSWTETLDAGTLVRIGAEVARRDGSSQELGFGTSEEEMKPFLDETEGWIGSHKIDGVTTAATPRALIARNGLVSQKLLLDDGTAVREGKFS